MSRIMSFFSFRSTAIFGLIVLLLVGAYLFATDALDRVVHVGAGDLGITLPLIAVGCVIVLILILTIVSSIFWFLDLSDKTQAMGLPEGSIRAVIALSLIVLFAILAVFLYDNVGGPVSTVENVSNADRMQFIKDHPAAKDLEAVVATKDGQTVKDKAGNDLYTITYRTPDQTSDDFAKQLLVVLGTLMTAITSFYLGAGTATSAAAQTAGAVMPKPTVTGINPTTYSIGKGGPTIHLQVLGSNLNSITQAKIVRGNLQIVGTNVASNPTRVTCDIGVSLGATPPDGAWDVVVDDGASRSVTLPASLTILA